MCSNKKTEKGISKKSHKGEYMATKIIALDELKDGRIGEEIQNAARNCEGAERENSQLEMFSEAV